MVVGTRHFNLRQFCRHRAFSLTKARCLFLGFLGVRSGREPPAIAEAVSAMSRAAGGPARRFGYFAFVGPNPTVGQETFTHLLFTLSTALGWQRLNQQI